MNTAFSLHFAPLLPLPYLGVAAVLGLAFFTLAVFKSRKGAFLRALTLFLFLLFLGNPSLVEEQREAVPDTAVVVVDQSQSQLIGRRSARANDALQYLLRQLGERKDLNLRIVRAPDASSTVPNSTLLFEALDRAMADIPLKRRAGVIFLTDGQIHDVPTHKEDFKKYGPVHAFLTGEKNERDRRIVIKNAPLYGLTGKSVTVTYSIEQTSVSSEDIPVTLKNYDGGEEHFNVPAGKEHSVELPITHAGQNVFELIAAPLDGELTQANNRAALIVNGVRDRLKVLLVSGKPHAGGRMWRDMLTSDPGVDLIHFTILREPEKLDATPTDEMSLIAFPFRELFETKLYDFDLIIFDQYSLNRVMPDGYFDNIVKFVNQGGAFLEASGPSFEGGDSIYNTSMQQILPGKPTGNVIEKPFLPHLSSDGDLHPVTRGLVWKGKTSAGDPAWGHWMRQAGIQVQHGDILMSGADNLPLLILDRVGQGRVAQLASDDIWLWARGYEGGGPHAELLRRVVHWLMKEPELDEKALDVKINGSDIIVRNQNFRAENNIVNMTKPDGTQQVLKLESAAGGYEAHVKADQLGIYGFADKEGGQRFVVIGDLNPPELSNVQTSPVPLAALMKESGGGALWLSETPHPNVRMLSNERNFAGSGWAALRQNHDYTVTGLKDRPLLPAWAISILLLGIAILAWWREGRL